MIDSPNDVPADYRPLLLALFALGCTVLDDVQAQYYEEYVVFDEFCGILACDYLLGSALRNAYLALTGMEWNEP